MGSYNSNEEIDSDNNTDTDTSSDDYQEPIDDSDLLGLTDQAACTEALWQYRQAKRKFRRVAGYKPVRRVRRFSKRASKGKGRGRSFGKGSYLESSDCQAYLTKKGKGRKGSGKGFGRYFQGKKNPIGKDGKPMLCHKCGSDSHLMNECPKNSSQHYNQSQPPAQPFFFSTFSISSALCYRLSR
jgi:hypothetical protein